MKAQLGVLKRVSPREFFASESRDFTPWLAEHLDILGEALGLDLELVQTEASVGDFSVDILAKDLATSHSVVIENQFGSTDHDHLGKLLTYASGIDASVLVWIAEEVREEHRQALEWINERTDQETFLFALKIELLKIDDSPAAPNFMPVVVPNKWQKAAREAVASDSTPRGDAYRRFFQALIDELREGHRFTKAKVAFPQNWYGFSSGTTDVSYNITFNKGNRVRAEIYINRRDQEANKRLFDSLFGRKQELEAKFGSELQWERLDDRQASRVAIYRDGSIDDDQTLTEIKAWAIIQLLKLKETFEPFLRGEEAPAA